MKICATPLRPATATWCFRLLGSCLIVVGWATLAAGQSTPEVVQVEEQWELVVATPEPDRSGPQVTTVISPVGHVGGIHAAFELNQQSLPEFTPGGLQLQVWNNEMPLAYCRFPSPVVMATADEQVVWTQTLTLSDGKLTFEIRNGQSTSWGRFGGQGYLKASVSTELENLNQYDPAVSVANSGVGYAANRVQSLVLKSVRRTLSTGEVLEDTTARVVYQQQ